MKKAIFRILTALFLISAVYGQSTIPAWKFIKETNGVKVFFRDMPYQKLHEVKILTTFNTNLSTIVAVMRDVPAYPTWVYKVDASKKVKDITNLEMIYYNHIDFPWPLSDRDVVIHTKVSQNAKTKEVISVSFAEPLAVPGNKDLVRIEVFNSKWTFTPKDKIVYGEYVFRSNPGGSIPAWLVNTSLDDGPVKTIQQLKKLLKMAKYQSLNDASIVN